jgi:hypothetical protein
MREDLTKVFEKEVQTAKERLHDTRYDPQSRFMKDSGAFSYGATPK